MNAFDLLADKKSHGPILLVDDDPICLALLADVLRTMGYEVVVANDGKQAFDLICQGDVRIVLSDWQMPALSGIELCRLIRRRQLSAYVYFILLTSLSRKENLVAGLEAGADDFLTKPFEPEELHVRLRVAERIVSLENRELIIFSLAKLAESRDPETGAHLERIREYCWLLTEHLSTVERYRGIVDADYIRTIFLTSPLHDIGKVGIADQVLLKPGPLTPDEFEVMKQHTVIGAQTLEAAIQAHPSAGYLRIARDIALTHHEKYDGSGYPHGLTGEEIPLCGRIIAVADVYDALTTKRVYKKAFTHDESRDIIVARRGKDFDPDIVDAFISRERDFVAVKQRFDQQCGKTLPTSIPSLKNWMALPERDPALA
jgi:putative two-component system response regulator